MPLIASYDIELPDLAAINAGNTGNQIGIRITNRDLAAVISMLNLAIRTMGASLGIGSDKVRLIGVEWTVQPDPNNGSNDLYSCSDGVLYINGQIVIISASSVSIPQSTPNVLPLWDITSSPDAAEPHILTDGITQHVVRSIISATLIADDPANNTSAIPYNEFKDVLQGEWINLTLDPDWNTVSYPLQYKKIGKQVYLRGFVRPNAANPSSSTITILPQEIIPQNSMSFVCRGTYPFGLPPQADYSLCINVDINSNGGVVVPRQFNNTGYGTYYDMSADLGTITYWLD